MALAAILSIVIGWLRRGTISRLASVRFPLWWLIILAFVMQASFPFIVDRIEYQIVFAMYLLSFALIVISLVFNARKRYIAVILAGVLMNLLAISLNVGMPYEPHLVKAGADEVKAINGLHVPANESTKLRFLGDWIAIPPPHPQPSVMSPGDIVIALGIFLFIQHAMTGGYAEAISQRPMTGGQKEPA